MISLRLLRFTALVCTLMCDPLSGLHAVAEETDVLQSKIRTAMVYNFVRFTNWPGARATGEVVLCVSPDDPLYRSLMTLSGKVVEQRPLRTVDLTPASAEECDIAYLSSSDVRRGVAEKLARNGTLTISADEDFAKAGMIGLVQIGRQNRFVVNNSLAADSGINFSSKLLRIAVEVH